MARLVDMRRAWLWLACVAFLAPAPVSGMRLKALNPLRLFRGDEPYLIEFYGVMCEQCDEMIKPMKRLEKKLKTRILKYEVWNDPGAYKLMQFLDKNPAGRSQCGGLPFFYNRRTGCVVCGATTEANLEDWATGKKHAVVLTPPPSQEQIRVQGRVTGAKARQQRIANEKKRDAVEKMRARNPAAAAGATKSLADKLPSNPRMPAPLQPKGESADDAAAES